MAGHIQAFKSETYWSESGLCPQSGLDIFIEGPSPQGSLSAAIRTMPGLSNGAIGKGEEAAQAESIE